MKVEIDILEEQIELLNRIKSIPKIIKEVIGVLPVSFPGGLYEIREIEQQIANLEFKCKKMIFDTCIVKEQLYIFFENTHLDSKSYVCKENEDY